MTEGTRAAAERCGNGWISHSILPLIALLASFQLSASPLDSGEAYLESSIQADGQVVGSNEVATRFQAAAETLLALSGSAPAADSITVFLESTPPEQLSTEFLALAVISPADSTNHRQELLLRQVRDGGFGALAHYPSDPLSTALALRALGKDAGEPSGRAVAYLLNTQNSDGSWGSSPSSTFFAMTALAPFERAFAGVSDALVKARNAALSLEAGEEAWQQAHRIYSLLVAGTDPAALSSAVGELQNAQLQNGSWNGDVYSTALAVQALRVFEARKLGLDPNSDTAILQGQVVLEGTGEPVPDAEVRVAGEAGVNVTTDSLGRYVIHNVAARQATLVAEAEGLSPTSIAVSAPAGELVDVPDIVLGISDNQGLLMGSITDAQTGSRLPGVAVSVQGLESRATTSDSDGKFIFGDLPTGNYEVVVANDGYRTETSVLDVQAGKVNEMRQPLVPTDTWTGDDPVNVSLRAVNAIDGVAIIGATASLNGRAVTSGEDGRVRFDGVTPGRVDISISDAEHASRLVSVNVPAGLDSHLGDIGLYPKDGPDAPQDFDLQLRLVNGLDGSPVSGASVTLESTGETFVSDLDGQVAIMNRESLEVLLVVSADGFLGTEVNLSASGYGSYAEMVRLTPANGDPDRTSSTIRGTVSNATTGNPVVGAQVALVGTSLVAETDDSGNYRIEPVESLDFTLETSASGYTPTRLASLLTAHGEYSLDIELEPRDLADAIEIVRHQVTGESEPGLIDGVSTIGNLADTPVETQLVVIVRDENGEIVGSTDVINAATGQAISRVNLEPGEQVAVEWLWRSGQAPVGIYKVELLASAPGTATREFPNGEVLDSAETLASLHSRAALAGAIRAMPPVVQVGSQEPVHFDAVLVNSGNTVLTGQDLIFEVTNETTGETVHTGAQQVELLDIAEHLPVSLGTWSPVTAGSFELKVRAANGDVRSNVVGELYVGDKPAATLSAEPSNVLPGDHRIAAAAELRGLDLSAGRSSDPLYEAIRLAVERGAEYTMPKTRSWQRQNRCMGCHVQTQAMVGMEHAKDFVDVDDKDMNFLRNSLNGIIRPDGKIINSTTGGSIVENALSVWALSDLVSLEESGRTLYEGLEKLDEWKTEPASDEVYWRVDRSDGWWRHWSATTYMVVKGLVRAVEEIEEGGIHYTKGVYDEYRNGGSRMYVNDIYIDGNYVYIPRHSKPVVERLNLETGDIDRVVQLSYYADLHSAVPADGGIYTGGNHYISFHSPSGERVPLQHGAFRSVRPAPGGGVYAIERKENRLSYFSKDGESRVILEDGYLSQPMGLLVEEDGKVLVSNRSDTSIVRVDPVSGDAEYVIRGLPEFPKQMARYGNGLLIVTEAFNNQWYSDGLLYLDLETGRVTNFVDYPRISGVAVTDGGDPFVIHSYANRMGFVKPQEFSATDSGKFRDLVSKAANYVRKEYRRDAFYRPRTATWLMILGEANKIESDPVVRDQNLQIMEELATDLRDMQKPDGGWGYRWYDASDAIVTSLAGMALEYTNPSRTDPVIRSSIEFLLDSQRPEGSWPSANSLMTTNLSATSLVMAYMPKALRRVGGLDMDLNLVVDDKRAVESPSISATDIVEAEQGEHHRWSLTGVTSDGRRIDFESVMPGLQIGESRPLVNEAWLEFRNSFTDEVIRMDIEIPEVKAVSGLAVSVDTDRAVYGAFGDVDIAGVVDNLKGVEESGSVSIEIRTANADEALATVGSVSIENIPADDTRPYALQWNTGTTLAGDYVVIATLTNSRGATADIATAGFRIDAPAQVVGGEISTDKPVYGGFDPVAITSRVKNLSANSLQRAMRAEIDVVSPGGDVIWSSVLEVPSMMPGGHADFPSMMTLDDAPEGDYAVELVVRDGISRNLLATSQAVFAVERRAGDALVGRVAPAMPWTYQGDPNTCTYTTTIRGGAPLESVEVIRQLVSLESGVTLAETSTTVSLGAGAQDLRAEAVDTADLEVGGYACRLLADVGTGPRQLAAGALGVLEPPIRIEAAMTTGERGRVLVLLDPACTDGTPPELPGNDCDVDPYGPDIAPPLPIQREHLEAVLEEAGWNATIVTSAAGFESEFASRAYELYALFSEQVKLPEALQHDVVADIEAGRGLLVAGNHDRRNGRLEAALGIKSLGKNLDTNTLKLAPSEIHPGGDIDFVIAHAPNAIREEGAETLAEYVLEQKGNKTPDPEPAITRHAAGNGTGIYASFDWPVQSAATGDDGELALLLDPTLTAAHPTPYTAIAGRVYPLRIELVNEGMATPGEIHLALPDGASLVESPQSHVIDGNSIRWPFDLAEDEILEFEAWIHLPETSGNADFNAVIYSGEADDLTEQATTNLTIEIHPVE